MIYLEQALEKIRQATVSMSSTEVIDLNHATGRVLATPVVADDEIPSMDKSAVDGFAIRSSDMGKPLKIIDFIAAGQKPSQVVEPGTCARIMTGAMVPEGADRVVMKEDVEHPDEHTMVISRSSGSANILYRGEDQHCGDLLLEAGTLLKEVHMGILASVGHTQVTVMKRPVVAILATGSELVEASQKPIPPMIRNSNGHQLEAQLRAWGAEVVNTGIVADDARRIEQSLRDLMSKVSGIILTGGASVGDLDHTGNVLRALGATEHFHKLAIQPGKPAFFATLENQWIFGLSGNPVSSFVQASLLVQPFLEHHYGCTGMPLSVALPLAKPLQRRKSDRDLFIPVCVEDGKVIPLEYHGSAHLTAYGMAQGMARFPRGKAQLNTNDLIDVRFL